MRFGQISIFDRASGNWVNFQLGDEKSCKASAHVIARYGLDYRDFSDRKRNTRQKNCGIAMESWMRAEEYVSRKQGTEYIYLADTKINDWRHGAIHLEEK